MSSTNPVAAKPTLSSRASAKASSAIRDLLTQAERPGMISLAGGLPDASLFPTEELAALTSELIMKRGRQILQYARTEGLDECRELFADRFHLGDPQQVLITSGSQQGLDLLARVLIDPGDQVIVSDPEYVGFLQVLRSYGGRPVAIPADDQGLDTERLAEQLEDGLRPKACYVIPHFQNPSGITISAERRAHLHQLSSRYGFVVIEDDPYRDLYHQHPTEDGAGSNPTKDVNADPAWMVRLRTTSKSLAPGLRVAAVHAPHHIHQAMVIAKQSADLHTSTLNQAIVTEAVQASWFAPHLDRLRLTYREKCTRLMEELTATFAGRVRLTPPKGGMFVWAEFDRQTSTADWLTAALEHDVCFVPGSAFAVDADLDRHVRLGFATASLAELTEGVARLAASADL